jgi:hypothetical protein
MLSVIFIQQKHALLWTHLVLSLDTIVLDLKY